AVLPARMDRYEPAMLDMLCLTGEVGWARLSPELDAESRPRLVGATPIALFPREHAHAWHALRLTRADDNPDAVESSLGPAARRVLEALRAHRASFLRELAAACNRGDDDCDPETAL